MSADLPPTIDARAAGRWAVREQRAAAWLHEEVGRRMQERLQWIRMQPRAWADWEPLRGGVQAHAAVARRYPKAPCWVVEPAPHRLRAAEQALATPWWRPSHWVGPPLRFGRVPDASVDMVWANMALHMAADPKSLLDGWHRMLDGDGFLMFSCLGPDTLRQVRALYRTLDWSAPMHDFTDMHDWGDMLVRSGFAEPVMDMERITLSFTTPERLLDELRGLGRNLHRQRFPSLRGRRWRARLLEGLAALRDAREPGAPLVLTFEIIYGHALKSRASLAVQAQTVLSLDEMRQVLRQHRRDPASAP